MIFDSSKAKESATTLIFDRNTNYQYHEWILEVCCFHARLRAPSGECITQCMHAQIYLQHQANVRSIPSESCCWCSKESPSILLLFPDSFKASPTQESCCSIDLDGFWPPVLHLCCCFLRGSWNLNDSSPLLVCVDCLVLCQYPPPLGTEPSSQHTQARETNH